MQLAWTDRQCVSLSDLSHMGYPVMNNGQSVTNQAKQEDEPSGCNCSFHFTDFGCAPDPCLLGCKNGKCPQTSSAEACGDLCLSNPLCYATAWNWYGTCYMQGKGARPRSLPHIRKDSKDTVGCLCRGPLNPPLPPMPPSPAPVVSPETKQAVFQDPIDVSGTLEGMWGGHLPVVSFHYRMQAGGWIEWTAVPVADMGGNREQDVYFRVLKLNETGDVVDVRYFDTYVYRSTDPIGGGGGGAPAGSPTANAFYQALLDQVRYWATTFHTEGVLQLELPSRPQDTDGRLLQHQAYHSMVRDMISRQDTFWPKYGILPGYYGNPGNNGFQDTFVGSMTMALEMGAFEYATGVLDNWLRYYLRKDGVRYRGPELAIDGRALTIFALFHSYTGDPTDLLYKNYESIMAVVGRLRMVRARGLAHGKDNARYGFGMPAANDEADMWTATVACGRLYGNESARSHDCITELPYIDIATEMVRGFYELGHTWIRIAAAKGDGALRGTGNLLVKESQELRLDMMQALEHSTVESDANLPNVNATCHPWIFGWGTCQHNGSPAYEASTYVMPTPNIGGTPKPYNTAMFSGVLPHAVVKDIVDFHKQYNSQLANISPWGPGAPGYCAFIAYGWGFGLIQHDLLDTFFVHYYTQSQHGMTRGTWTAPECPVFDRDKASSGYAAPSQALLPTLTKWMLVFEDPETEVLWLGKAIPRVWLSEGERVLIHEAPTRYGRVSLEISARSSEIFEANITLPTGFSWPAGGIRLRLRTPGFPGKRLANATVAGKPWPVNATEESVAFAPNAVSTQDLQAVVVNTA